MDYKQHKGNLRGKIKDKVERKLYNKQIRAQMTPTKQFLNFENEAEECPICHAKPVYGYVCGNCQEEGFYDARQSINE